MVIARSVRNQSKRDFVRLKRSRAKGKAYGVIGGGETLQSMDLVGMREFVDLVSTGGGSMLEYLSGKELPGIKALKN